MPIARQNLENIIKLFSILAIQIAIIIPLINSFEEGFEERLLPIILIDLLLIILMYLIIDWGVKSIYHPANIDFYRRFLILISICSFPAVYGIVKAFFFPEILPIVSLILPYVITLSWLGNLVCYFKLIPKKG